MGVIKEAKLPRDEKGNDPNDHRNESEYMQRLRYSFVQTLGKSGTAPVFRFRPLSEIRNGLTGPQYLIKPFLERSILAVMFGESGCYKSFLATDIGLCLAYASTSTDTARIKALCSISVVKGMEESDGGWRHG